MLLHANYPPAPTGKENGSSSMLQIYRVFLESPSHNSHVCTTRLALCLVFVSLKFSTGLPNDGEHLLINPFCCHHANIYIYQQDTSRMLINRSQATAIVPASPETTDDLRTAAYALSLLAQIINRHQKNADVDSNGTYSHRHHHHHAAAMPLPLPRTANTVATT